MKMRNGVEKAQIKDIPTEPILEFLRALKAKGSGLGCIYEPLTSDDYPTSVLRAMPAGTPEKLALRKMRQLIRSGQITGCYCGCRGDFEIN